MSGPNDRLFDCEQLILAPSASVADTSWPRGAHGSPLSGFTSQVSPSISLVYRPDSATAFHTGLARYFQVPSLLGVSPTAQAAFAGTTAAGPPGIPRRCQKTTASGTAVSCGRSPNASPCRPMDSIAGRREIIGERRAKAPELKAGA
jgi:hypothetical protein